MEPFACVLGFRTNPACVAAMEASFAAVCEEKSRASEGGCLKGCLREDSHGFLILVDFSRLHVHSLV